MNIISKPLMWDIPLARTAHHKSGGLQLYLLHPSRFCASCRGRSPLSKGQPFRSDFFCPITQLYTVPVGMGVLCLAAVADSGPFSEVVKHIWFLYELDRGVAVGLGEG